MFRQILLFIKKDKLLIFLLAAFFIKQLLFVAVFPIFQGPDEPAHYSTIQHKAESKDVAAFITKQKNIRNRDENNTMTSTFDFSEEILNTMNLAETNKIAFHSSTTQTFANNSSNGQFEKEIKNNNWDRYIPYKHPSIIYGVPGYYFLPTIIEKSLAESDIFTRFFIERIFSAILGIFILLFIYLSAKKIGLDEKISFLATTLVAFQPMFSQSAAIVNYDVLLIFAFSLFTFGAVLSLRDGINWKNGLVMFFSAIVGILTKFPAVVLWIIMIILAVYFARKHFRVSNRIFILSALNLFLLTLTLANIFFPENHLIQMIAFSNEKSKFSSVFHSVTEYISVTLDRWNWSELSYWGNFGWLDAKISSWIVTVAHIIEITGIIGIAVYFIFPKKIPDFLPKKKFVIFFIGFFLALELAIRFADWEYYNRTGKIGLGTPGRYFLPVIGAQFFLITIGIGMLVKKYLIWKNILKVLVMSMILLWIYSVLIIIIPRYYL